ncbi:SLATT domain-containing protein [Tenacibaculum caenipelagi]|uniref:SMODS and SLOG-associating 2TM effector domain-containing protein n=1 Tax=Tenacibaculum caenipelagi TaxID=1325435 RepID=A0A4R6TA63_9FLAO|nr:SLATT domain-containing protein [Tenacibaculum caenipelagi]TDQ22668.1 hypothetical protein DFQ07_2685 [Tenacibaculum caenipelagi]
MEDEIKLLNKKIKETKGSRFVAAKRLEDIDTWSSLTINIFSVYIIVVNLLVLIEPRPAFLTGNFITFITVSFSILILVLSNIINARNYKSKSTEYHNCGTQLSVLSDKLYFYINGLTTPNIYDIKNISKDYNVIIQKSNLNHKSIDFDYYRMKRINDEEYNYIKNKNWFIFKVWIEFNYVSKIKYILIIALPLISTLILF